MEIENLEFDFEMFDGNGKGRKGSRPITGNTITVYHNHLAIAKELYQKMGSPENISVAYERKTNRIVLWASEDGFHVSANRSTQISNSNLIHAIEKIVDVDTSTHYFRLNNGEIFLGRVWFDPENVEVFKSERKCNKRMKKEKNDGK